MRNTWSDDEKAALKEIEREYRKKRGPAEAKRMAKIHGMDLLKGHCATVWKDGWYHWHLTPAGNAVIAAHKETNS